jgi:predicted kinase
VLDSGRPVILDASFRSRALREGARSLARRHGVPFFFVECRVSREEMERRLEKRAQDPCVSDGRREILDAFIATWEPTEELASAEHVLLDTSRPVDAILDTLRRRLPAWPSGLNG